MFYTLNGKKVDRKEFLKDKKGIDFKKGIVMSRLPSTWPMASDSLGVNPDQAKEAYEESVRQGCPTQFDSEGRAILTSPGHRKRYAEANGIYDLNGGYSDPQRN